MKDNPYKSKYFWPGKKFGELEIIEKISTLLYKAKCCCGSIKVYERNNLLRRKVATCNDCSSKKIHGHASVPGKTSITYNSWTCMKSRCNNPNYSEAHLYGARGIKVCDRWNENFINFLADMGERPSKDHTIDRIDPNGNYEPSNCRWATRSEQQQNKRFKEKIIHEFICAICNVKFVDKKKNSRMYCSLKCSSIAQSTKVKKKCANCKKIIFVKNNRSNRTNYCSKECYYAALKTSN